MVDLRDARDDDAAGIAAIYAREVLDGTATYEVVPPDAREMLARMAIARDAGFTWRVAEQDGEIAGYAYASPYRARAGYRFTVEDSIYVAPVHQGRGIGMRLLVDLIDRCAGLGYRQMIAVIGDEENVASVALHERAGFHRAARFPGIGRKHGRWLTGLQMQRALGDGDRTPPFAEPDAAA